MSHFLLTIFDHIRCMFNLDIFDVSFIPVIILVCAVLQEDLDLPFTDEMFWRRRAHPNFKQHIDLEKRVIKIGKTVSFNP